MIDIMYVAPEGNMYVAPVEKKCRYSYIPGARKTYSGQ